MKSQILAFSILLTSGGPAYAYEADRIDNFAADPVAGRVGDALIVTVIESALAESNAGASGERQLAIGADISSASAGHDLGVGYRRSHAADSALVRSGKVLAEISVAVTRVLPNGNLEVAGSQIIKIDDNQQQISVSGIVRPVDIAAGNMVSSNRLMDSRITYSGFGSLRRGGTESWLSQLLTWLGL